MKNIIIVALTTLMMVGCISDDAEAKIYEEDSFATLTYDSCEYVFKTAGYKGFLAHKGNCHFYKDLKANIHKFIEQLKYKQN